MAIPIADENPTNNHKKLNVNLIIIILNVLVFILYQNGLFSDVTRESVISMGLIPVVFWGDQILPPEYYVFPPDFSVFTYMFLHANLMHVVTNLLILWVFGDNIEHDLGKANYIFFYVLGGVFAGVLHAVFNASSVGPLVGASGAISAIGAAYLLMHPRAHIWILVFWLIPVKVPAWAAITAWFAYQIYAGLGADDQGVAWWAHIGGFVFGFAYILMFKRQYIDPKVRSILRLG